MRKTVFWRYIREIIFGIFGAIFMILLAGIVTAIFVYFVYVPDISNIVDFHPAETSVIYDRSGETALYEIHGEENRRVLEHKEIPDVVRFATVITEDKNFYRHFGFDFLSIIRAFKVNVESGDIYQGGSTITQQLARNIYLSREKTWRRKVMEILIALKIERALTKDEILDRYLNQVPYGSNAYGIEAAAQTFFGKKAIDLSLDEAVLLASLPKAPTYYSPYGDKKEELILRYQSIFDQFEKQKILSTKEVARMKKIDVLKKINFNQEKILAPHFVFYVIEDLEKKYGREFLEESGLDIITTLDFDLQKKAERIVSDGAERNLENGATNASLVAVDPKSGEILVMVGSRNFFDQTADGQVNVATSLRQPGSSFKPIVYATAFEKGYGPDTLIDDVPTNFGSDGSGGDYIPQNYDGSFHGRLPMRKALSMSLNIPAIKTLSMVGIDSTIDMAHRLGISTLNERNRYGLSLAIGGAEVKLVDMVGAFSVFAADGKRHPLRHVREIVNNKNEAYYEKMQEDQVISFDVARKINSILSDNDARSATFGKNSPLYIPGKSVAAKTGTSQDFRDAWTVGYSPSIAVGVWVGNNDARLMKTGSDGVFVAAPIWRSFMDVALPLYADEKF